jgi:hypothetical protein
MGVPASGATLEIQLVADVARLQRDMKAMQDVVGNATDRAGKSLRRRVGAGGQIRRRKWRRRAGQRARARRPGRWLNAIGLSAPTRGSSSLECSTSPKI